MRECQSEFLIFLDDDAYFVDTTGLPRAVRLLRDSPDVAVVAFRILLMKPYEWRLSTYPDGQTAWFQSGACLMRPEMALGVAGYSDEFKYGAEDLDLSCRLFVSGHRVMHEPRVTVEHLYYHVPRGDSGEEYMDFHFARGQAAAKWRTFPVAVAMLESLVHALRLADPRGANPCSRLAGLVSGIQLGLSLRERERTMGYSQYRYFRRLMRATSGRSREIEQRRERLHEVLRLPGAGCEKEQA